MALIAHFPISSCKSHFSLTICLLGHYRHSSSLYIYPKERVFQLPSVDDISLAIDLVCVCVSESSRQKTSKDDFSNEVFLSEFIGVERKILLCLEVKKFGVNSMFTQPHHHHHREEKGSERCFNGAG